MVVCSRDFFKLFLSLSLTSLLPGAFDMLPRVVGVLSMCKPRAAHTTHLHKQSLRTMNECKRSGGRQKEKKANNVVYILFFFFSQSVRVQSVWCSHLISFFFEYTHISSARERTSQSRTHSLSLSRFSLTLTVCLRIHVKYVRKIVFYSLRLNVHDTITEFLSLLAK